MASSKLELLTRKPPYLGVLATVYPSGGPQAFPVWFEYDGQHIYVVTWRRAAKLRNIRHNARVALCVTDTCRETDTLTVLGRAEIIQDNAWAQEIHRREAVRYMGPERGQAYADSMAGEELAVIRITPERFI